MRRRMYFLIPVLLLVVAPFAAAQEDSLTFRDIGIGIAVHGQTLNCDVQDNGEFFRAAKTPWTIGATLKGEVTLFRFEDILRMSATGDAGFHPVKASADQIGGLQPPTSYEIKDNIWDFAVGLHSEFFPTSVLRPFVFVQLGYMIFDPQVTLTPNALPAGLEEYRTSTETSSLSLPIGVGLAFAFNKNLDIFGSFHKTYTFTDNLDGWLSEINDNFPVISLGLKWYFTSEREQERVIEKVVPPPPVVEDTDGDGLKDVDERTIYKTDPTKKDTDGDGLMDGEEVKTYKTDPLNKDTDGDRLMDGDEVLRYKTNPLNKDTDADGCDDGKEVLDMKTDPLKPDTDGDTLTDCDELNRYKTNPLRFDTDDDGVGDGQELKNGTNPLKADVLKIDEQKPITLEGIVFETNKYTIKPESEEILTKAFNTMNAYPTLVVEIAGHTDDVGKDAANQTLSENRAKAVRQWLVNKGVDGNRVKFVGFGEKQPKVPNTSPENRQINRRIDFRIISR